MVWSPLLIVVVITLFAVGALIFSIENWSRVEHHLSGWGWLFEVPMALLFAYSAVESWRGSDVIGAAINVSLATMFAWLAAARIKRLQQSRVE